MATLLLAAVAAPANAERPEVAEEPIFMLWPDEGNGVAVFWNITRDNFCDWEAGGFEGRPPVEQLVRTNILVTEDGAVQGRYSATRPIELWTFDDDVPPLIGACEDTDDQAGPWATGYSHAAAHDDDFEGMTLPVNTFGDRGDGHVYDSAGDAWNYSWMFRIWDGGEDSFRVFDEGVLEKL
jgi:hypothetical protein